MAEILQIIPTNPGDRIAWYVGGGGEPRIDYVTPACLALVKEGSRTSVVYMEVVDNEVTIVDQEDEDFLGFYNTDGGSGYQVEVNFEKRKKANGKSK